MKNDFGTAVNLHQEGRVDNALRLYRKCLKTDAANPQLHYLIGTAWAQKNDPAKAEPALRRALSLSPGLFPARANLVRILQLAGRHDEALEQATQATATQPENEEAWRLCLECGRASGMVDGVLAALTETALQPQAPLEVVRLAASAQMEAGNCRQALKIAEARSDPHSLAIQGYCLEAAQAFEKAAEIYRRLLTLEPNHYQALNGLGNILRMAHKYQEAEALLRRAIAIDPRIAAGPNNLALLLRRLGRLDEAADLLRTILSQYPDAPEPLANLGTIALEQGHVDEAIVLLRRALARKPDVPQTLNNLGNALKEIGEAEEAAICFERALSLLGEGGDEVGYRRLVRHLELAVAQGHIQPAPPAPRPVEGAFVSIVVCSNRPQRAQAIRTHYRELFNQCPHELILIDDARSLCEGYQRGFAAARGDILVFSHDDVRFLNPDLPALLADRLGTFDLLGLAGTTRLAAPTWGKAGWPFQQGIIAHREGNGLEVSIFGDTRALRGEIQAVDGLWFACRRGVVERLGFDAETFDGFHLYDLDFSYRAWRAGFRLGVCSDFAVIHDSKGNFDHVWETYAQRFLARHGANLLPMPEKSRTLGAGIPLKSDNEYLAFSLAYNGALPLPGPGNGEDLTDENVARNAWNHLIFDDEQGDELRRQQQAFNEAFVAPWRPFRIAPRPRRGKPFRVGFLSPDFRNHPVGRFVEPLFTHHDRENWQFIAYSTCSRPDEKTALLRTLVDTWRDVADVGDAALARQMADDGLAILVDLAGHTAGARPQALALKPAPVLLEFLGYASQTDIETIDATLADTFTEPSDSDAILRLPGSYFCFTPAQGAPEVAPLPALVRGYPTFGYCGQVAKISSATLEHWRALLAALPSSRLVIRAKGATSPAVSNKILAGLEVAPERVSFAERLPYFDYLAAFADLDILLDSYPFNLATNTVDALWMGVPVLSRSGQRHASRMGLSILSAAGLADTWVAENKEDFVAKGISWVERIGELAALRSELRARIATSALVDGRNFAARFQQTLADYLQRRS